MIYLVTVFVLGLVIATVINRMFPRTITQEVVVDNTRTDGEFITNEEFIALVSDLSVRIPNSVIHINHNNVLFVTPSTGKVWSLTLKDRWYEVTADYRKVGNTRPQLESKDEVFA